MFNTDFIAQRSKFHTRIVKAARISVQAPQFSLSISDDSLSDSQQVRRYRIVVSTPRCGRGNRSSNLRIDMRLLFTLEKAAHAGLTPPGNGGGLCETRLAMKGV